jgi:hypothetical protein
MFIAGIGRQDRGAGAAGQAEAWATPRGIRLPPNRRALVRVTTRVEGADPRSDASLTPHVDLAGSL